MKDYELDDLVATHIMKMPVGWFRFSADIKDAMLVVDELKQRVKYMGTYRDGFRMHWNGKQWHVGFTASTDADCRDTHFEWDWKGDKYNSTETYGPCESASLPHAICLYALKVYGINPGTPCASNPKAMTEPGT